LANLNERYLQLYSLKDALAADFIGTLVRVRQMGYTGVEFAGNYGGFGAFELRHTITSLGMKLIGGHVQTANIPEQLDLLKGASFPYVVDPYREMATEAEALQAAKDFNEAGKLCRDAGIKFAYHNHRHEFAKAGDKYLLEILLENTDPALVAFQLDVGWTAYAGVDPAEFIAKYAGRFPLIHVKECTRVHTDGDDERSWNGKLGTGIVDWAAVKKAALAQGAGAFIVEREFDYADDIFKCCEEDCKFLQNL
jgi:sugar phosphate isomerase/epimerase